MTLVTVNSTKAETVTIPYLASFAGAPFTDKESLCVLPAVSSSESEAHHIFTLAGPITALRPTLPMELT